jgi:hypothetical protein
MSNNILNLPINDITIDDLRGYQGLGFDTS